MNTNRCLGCGVFLVGAPEHHVRCRECWRALRMRFDRVLAGRETNPYNVIDELEKQLERSCLDHER